MQLEKIRDYKRIYQDEDIAAIFSLTFFSPSSGRIRSAAEGVYSKQQGQFFIAKESDETVGIIGATFQNQYLVRLHHLAVKPAFMGKGIAREMVTAMLRELGVPKIEAQVSYSQYKFLEHLGFKIISEDNASDLILCLKKIKMS